MIERKKAIRKLKQAVKAALRDQEENEGAIKSEFLENLQKAEVDLYYTVLFPLDKKYISLYPTSDANDSETKNAREDFLNDLKTQIKSKELPSGLHPKKKESKAYFEVERIRKQGPTTHHSNQGSQQDSDLKANNAEKSMEKVDQEDEFFA